MKILITKNVCCNTHAANEHKICQYEKEVLLKKDQTVLKSPPRLHKKNESCGMFLVGSSFFYLLSLHNFGVLKIIRNIVLPIDKTIDGSLNAKQIFWVGITCP